MICYFAIITYSKLSLPDCMDLTCPCCSEKPTIVIESTAPTPQIPMEVRFVAGCFWYVHFAIFPLTCGIHVNELRLIMKSEWPKFVKKKKSKCSVDPTISGPRPPLARDVRCNFHCSRYSFMTEYILLFSNVLSLQIKNRVSMSNCPDWPLPLWSILGGTRTSAIKSAGVNKPM